MNRKTGILCPIASLNGDFGIGQLGQSAYDFIDFLSECGYSYWQILPINPVGAGNSPYSSPSAFAGYYALIDPLKVVEWGLTTSLNLPHDISPSQDKVNYGIVENSMEIFLRKTFDDFFQKANQDFLAAFDLFKTKNNDWLNDFALYAAIKTHFDASPWYEWPEPYKYYNNITSSNTKGFKKEIQFAKFVQFLFFKQWEEIKAYATKKKVQIIGDMPIYVSHDSADVWSNPNLFELNEDLSLRNVAGVPPDFFAQDGQLWGFPIYNWQVHKKTSFKWWTSRWKHMAAMFDFVRFDHFRAIEAYWSVPANHDTARYGQWVKAPGKKLLEAIYPKNSKGMIAENLGDISTEVEELRIDFGIPGMKIFQFAFGGHVLSEHLPHYAANDDIYYSGTHDNDVLSSWLNNASDELLNHLEKYYGASREAFTSSWLIDRILASGVSTCIFPIQDMFELGAESRTNTPGTVSDNNWSWRLTKEQLNSINNSQMRDRLAFFGR